MIWALDAMKSGRPEEARRYLSFPEAAATSDPTSKYAIHDWELETLVMQLLCQEKEEKREGKNRIANCESFEFSSRIINVLRNFENAEAGVYLDSLNILLELHRISHRQFSWQRGYFNVVQFYRYYFIYGQGNLAAFFEKKYGLTISDFSMVGFAMYSAAKKAPWINAASVSSLSSVGISPMVSATALRLLSVPILRARKEALDLKRNSERSSGGPLPVAYQPSYL
ncbi:hypothetical protein, partial [Inquilinus limosus]|uniref:hypothetical protein n=1 Tax=Inquilinus limosus TaxID=171674 RepID=UPI00126A5DAF